MFINNNKKKQRILTNQDSTTDRLKRKLDNSQIIQQDFDVFGNYQNENKT